MQGAVIFNFLGASSFCAGVFFLIVLFSVILLFFCLMFNLVVFLFIFLCLHLYFFPSTSVWLCFLACTSLFLSYIFVQSSFCHFPFLYLPLLPFVLLPLLFLLFHILLSSVRLFFSPLLHSPSSPHLHVNLSSVFPYYLLLFFCLLHSFWPLFFSFNFSVFSQKVEVCTHSTIFLCLNNPSHRSSKTSS